MQLQEKVPLIMDEIHASLQSGYLSEEQVEIVESRINDHLTYTDIIQYYGISGRTALTHALARTSCLEYWNKGMNGQGNSYLSKFDIDLFLKIIGDAADDSNCIPCIYAVSLAHYLKKKRNEKAYILLTFMNCRELAMKFTNADPPCRSWIYNVMKKTNFRVLTGQTIEFERRHMCDTMIIFFYFKLHEELFQRPASLILNMDETQLTAKRRLKVLARKGMLPLIPDAVKVPHLTGCVTFTASGFVFEPLIILPNKKTLRTLESYNQLAYFASSHAGWMTSNIFIFYCLYLVCQLSSYRLTLPQKLREEPILFLSDGHPSRYTFKALLILYLFNIQLVLIPPHTSHLLQAFDVAVASPLKSYFKDELVSQRFNLYIQDGVDIKKQTSRELRDSLINAFLNALRKSCSTENISMGFKKTGFVPVNAGAPLSSQFAMIPENVNYDNDHLLQDYYLNSERRLRELFQKENGREMQEADFNIQLREIVQELKKASIEDGKCLSDLPPLFNDDISGIVGYRL